MTNTDKNFCVILAGGKGRRLWPCSREQYPKQFVDFFGTGRTQLQNTYDRMAKIIPPGHIFINTNMQYADLVRSQLPELPADNLLVEPIHRNTAPSIAWATYRIAHLNPEACIITIPSDQTVFNEEAFSQNVQEGLEFVASRDCFLALGIKPTRPEPGYGYIQLGEQEGHDLYQVKSFTEKPDREFARMFVDSGEFYWNTGIYISNVANLQECFSRVLPPVLRLFNGEDRAVSPADEDAYMKENFPSYPNLSIDFAILEKSENVYVMKCDFGWADLGTWHTIYEAMSKGEGDNVVVDSDVLLEDCRNNVIKLSHGRLGVINGLDGYIVAEKDNVLLICKKEDSSSLIRKYVNEVRMKKGEEFV